MKSVLIEAKTRVNRATSLSFIILLFGALGAGFFFVVQNILGIQHILGALEPANENILWFILFWSTDFFFIPFVMILCYLIAGIPAIAPSLALSIYFVHFAGTPVAGADAYFSFFATPKNGGGGANLSYMGFLLMALLLSFLIKYLYMGWDSAKDSLGKKLDTPITALRKKIKLIPSTLTGNELLNGIDLIVLILLVPVISAAITFVAIRYGIQLPFDALSRAIIEPLTNLSTVSVVITGIVFGLMVGFDIIGPVSMAAFAVAVAAFADGNSQLITIYGACFITIGWIPLAAVLASKITKKGGKTDNDDFNLGVSGPINAFFENVKLTVAFTMPYAYKSPLTVVPGLMTGCAFTGFLTAVFGINNISYLTEMPKYGTGMTYAQLFERGENYLSFTLPLRSGDWLRCRIPLFFIIIAGAIVGGIVIFLLKRVEYRNEKKHGTYVEHKSDVVVEMRNLAKSFRKETK